MPGRWQLLICGPVRVLHDGVERPLPVRRCQALLVLLALGGAQHRARLSALLWPQLDEKSSRRNLRRELARLREHGVEALVANDGERLRLAPGVTCDANAGSALPAAGHTLADGLALADAEEFSGWLDAQRERHGQRWRQAQADAAVAREASGDLAGALAHVQALLAADPLHEAMHRSAMRLLAALDQRHAAWHQFERCRELLAQELGLEPMAETQAVAESLRGLPVAATPKASPASALEATAATAADLAGRPVVLPTLLPLVGREDEVRELEAWWLRGGGACGGIAFLEGEGGIGKTRLASEFLAAHGAYAHVACRPGDRAVPYAALARALRTLGAESGQALPVDAWAQAELAPLLAHRAPAPTSRSDRARLHQALALAWRSLLGPSEAESDRSDKAMPAVANFDAVLIDDFHLADDASQSWWAERCQPQQGGPGTRLLLLMRGHELGDAGRAAMARLAPQATRLTLAPLPDRDVLALVRQLSGATDATRFAHRLETATAGNPFFLAQTLHHLADAGLLKIDAQGVWQTPFDGATQDYRELPVPPHVGAAILARVQRLPDASQRLLQAACLAAEPFAPALLAGACALSELEAMHAMTPALHARLLRDADRGAYAFVHDLAAQALRDSLPPQRQRLLHRSLALAAEQAGAEPAGVAAHLEAAGDPARAVAPRMAAAERALRLHATHDAQSHWQQALANGPTPAQRVNILGRLGVVQRDLGLGPAVLETIAELDRLRAEVGDDTLALAASVDAAYLCNQVNRANEVESRIAAVLATGLADPQLRLRALEARVMAWNIRGDYSRAEAAAEEMLAEPGTRGATRLRVLAMTFHSQFASARPLAALETAQRLRDAAQAVGDRRIESAALSRLGMLMDVMAQPVAQVEAVLEQARAIAADLALVEQQRETLLILAGLAKRGGFNTRSLELLEQGWVLAPTFVRPEKQAGFLIGRHEALAQLGQLGQALDAADAALVCIATVPDPEAWENAVSTTLDLFTDLGLHAEAHARLARIPPQTPGQASRLRVKLTFNTSLLALREARLDDAEAQLHALGSPEEHGDREDRAALKLRWAQLHLARCRPAEALALLVAPEPEWPTVALHAGALETALAAELMLAGERNDTTQRGPAATAARSALESTGLGDRLPALGRLSLRWRLSQAGRACDGRPDAGAQANADHAAATTLAQALAASLQGHPRAQAAFRRRWPAAGSA
jgi:DNA-binding SARP family transcriptional activator